MRTRTLTSLAAALLLTGLASAGIGLHVTSSSAAVRAGVVLIIAAAVPAVAAQVARGGAAAEDTRRAFLDGYRTGLMHAALGLLDDPSDGGHAADAPNSYARGHLYAVTDEPERKAE